MREGGKQFEGEGETPEERAEREGREQLRIEHEELRVELLEDLKGVGRKFFEWAELEKGYAKERERGEGEETQSKEREKNAGMAALEVMRAILRGDSNAVVGKMDRMAFELGYKVSEDEETTRTMRRKPYNFGFFSKENR